MQDVRVAYKQDDLGNDIFARLAWLSDASLETSRPIALIFHGGGLIVGSSAIIPKPQVEWLASNGFMVVIPNYRLAPQVTGKMSYADCERAYDWAVGSLPGIMSSRHGITVDSRSVVTMGHSSGGTIALHVAASKDVKAVAAFYPSLYFGDTSTSSHHPTSVPPFGLVPDYEPSQDDWAIIRPSDKQLSEAPLGVPGAAPTSRSKWQMNVLKSGQWMKAICPDGDYKALDPLARRDNTFPTTIIIQGEDDNVPGSDLALAKRATQELESRGTDVRLVTVPGAAHMFDLPPMVGTSDLGPKWEAVLGALDFLKQSVESVH